MNKVILFLALGLMFIASPSIASECADGETWQADLQEVCTAWSTPECTNYEWQCDRYWHGRCVDWDRVCTAWGESTCTSTETVDNGVCVSLGEVPTEPEPTCESGFKYKGTYTNGFYTGDVLIRGYWTGLCESTGGASWLQLAPVIRTVAMENNRTVKILFSRMGECSLLLRNANGTMDTFPIGNESEIQTWGFSPERLKYHSPENNWGYNFNILSSTIGTAHYIPVTYNVAPGIYRARAVCTEIGKYNKVFSLESDMIVL